MSNLIETKAEFQDLAEKRLEEAKALLDLGLWDGAYYLTGYAIELALKACIIKSLMVTDAFPDKDFSKNCYTHSIAMLLKLAKLEIAWKAATDVDKVLDRNWELAKDWSEQKRYYRINKNEAEELYTATSDGGHGVLLWIKTHW